MPSPQLVVGTSSKLRAGSYTQFILPFAYQLNKISCPKSRLGTHENADTGKKISEDKESAQSKLAFHPLCTCIVRERLDGTLQCARCKGLRPLEEIAYRRDYLTSETGNVLFERAKWFELGGFKRNCYRRFTPFFCVRVNSKCIKVRIEAAQLVMFEFPDPSPSSRTEKTASLLQIGFLIITTRFGRSKDTITLSDLCNFNESFRYVSKPWPEHFEQVGKSFIAPVAVETLVGSKQAKGPQGGGAQPSNEDLFYGKFFRYLDNFHIELGRDRLKVDYQLKAGEDGHHPNRAQRNTFPDNRTFVRTCAVAKPRELERMTGEGLWAKLLNIDYTTSDTVGPPSLTRFNESWLKDRTYRRWEHYNTLYGFTEHSGAMLGYGSTDPPTHMHFKQMYLDQILLLLYLRCGLFRFSARLNQITGDALNGTHSKKREKKWEDAFLETRRDFTFFTNLYQFPLLSTQQQALEMYSMARKMMVVDELFKEVQEEIKDSHDYLQQKHNRDQAEIVRKLSMVATIFVPATLFTGYFGMDGEWGKQIRDLSYGECIGVRCLNEFGWLLLVTITLSIISILVIIRYLTPKK